MKRSRLALANLPVLILLLCYQLTSAVFCGAQTTPEPQKPPSASAPKQDSAGDQPPAQGQVQDQNSTAPSDTKKEDTKKEDTKKKDDRMFYVMPNYLTVDGEAQTAPVSWKEKFAMAAKGSFDPYEFFIVGVVSGIRQADNTDPDFGQGAQGYGKRYGTAFADQVDGNIMVGGVFPTILKTDPRYFRLGRGAFAHRFGYAISRIFVTRRDSGSSMFNIPEFAGNATAIAISTAYYPASDRSFSSSFSGWGTQMGLDAFGNELKEFWPDVHHYLERRHARHLEKKTTD